MKHITEVNLPCWFELSWDEKDRQIILRVHEWLATTLTKVKADSPIVKAMIENFSFPNFSSEIDRGNGWGFESSFGFGGSEGEFFSFRIPLPKIFTYGDLRCQYCSGDGEDRNFRGRKCGSCDGTGRNTQFDWRRAYAVSATFSLFTLCSRYPDQIIGHAGLPQLLTFQTITDHGQHGGSLDGEFSILLCEWLSRHQPDTPIVEVEKAMKIAYGSMFRLRDYNKHDFRATQRGSGIIHARCPGDACEIHPSYPCSEPLRGEGGAFTCHNVDSPLQQLTLVAGLAALHDKARKEIV